MVWHYFRGMSNAFFLQSTRIDIMYGWWYRSTYTKLRLPLYHCVYMLPSTTPTAMAAKATTTVLIDVPVSVSQIVYFQIECKRFRAFETNLLKFCVIFFLSYLKIMTVYGEGAVRVSNDKCNVALSTRIHSFIYHQRISLYCILTEEIKPKGDQVFSGRTIIIFIRGHSFVFSLSRDFPWRMKTLLIQDIF